MVASLSGPHGLNAMPQCNEARQAGEAVMARWGRRSRSRRRGRTEPPASGEMASGDRGEVVRGAAGAKRDGCGGAVERLSKARRTTTILYFARHLKKASGAGTKSKRLC